MIGAKATRSCLACVPSSTLFLLLYFCLSGELASLRVLAVEITVDPTLEPSRFDRRPEALSPTDYGRELVRQFRPDGKATLEYVSPCANCVACNGWHKRVYFGQDRESTPRSSLTMQNSFVEAVHTAYDRHYPLRLSPDSVWLCILHGLAQHVDLNSEQLRNNFVNFTGKETIKVRNDNFVKGGKNDWSRVLGEFSSALAERLAPTVVENLLCNFSTTDRVSLAASEVALMDVMKNYFNYVFSTTCGIPKVTLEGTVADWQRVLEKAKAIRQYELDWWIDELQPVLEKLVLAAQGEVDREFWQSFYKLHRPGSGGPYINGWILTLFPYLVRGSGQKPTIVNKAIGSWRRSKEKGTFVPGVMTRDLPCGVSRPPFLWISHNVEYNMEFYSGFFGVEQDNATLALKPHIGFAVVKLK